MRGTVKGASVFEVCSTRAPNSYEIACFAQPQLLDKTRSCYRLGFLTLITRPVAVGPHCWVTRRPFVCTVVGRQSPTMQVLSGGVYSCTHFLRTQLHPLRIGEDDRS